VQDLRFRAKVLLGGAKVARAASGHAAVQRDEMAAPDESCHLIPPAEGVVWPNDSTVRSGVPQDKKGFRFLPSRPI
jgi:hypothetical protein